MTSSSQANWAHTLTPEWRAMQSERARARWRDPEYRAMMSARQSAAAKARHKSAKQMAAAAKARAALAAKVAGVTMPTKPPSQPVPDNVPAPQPIYQPKGVAPVSVDDVDDTDRRQRGQLAAEATRQRTAERQRLDVSRRHRDATQRVLRHGVLSRDLLLTYKCSRGHTTKYIRDRGTPWSMTNQACYLCPATEWSTQLFPVSSSDPPPRRLDDDVYDDPGVVDGHSGHRSRSSPYLPVGV